MRENEKSSIVKSSPDTALRMALAALHQIVNTKDITPVVFKQIAADAILKIERLK